MLTYSPEAAFLLAVFALVLSGIPLVTLVWIQFRERTPSSGRPMLVAGFFLLGVAFASQAVYHHLAVPGDGLLHEGFERLLLAADIARLGASVSLAVAVLVHHRRLFRSRAFGVAATALTLTALLWVSGEGAAGLGRIDPSSPLRLADGAILGLGAVMVGGLSLASATALLLLAGARASALVAAFWPAASEGAWGVGWVLTLSGLVLMAIAVERESRRTLLHHVLRFNLVFLTLAASLTVMLAEITRRQFVDFSLLQTHDFAEFVRGYLIHQRQQGVDPGVILASADLTDRIVREFGRYPDLRRVRLALGGRTVEFTINRIGEISRHAWTGARTDPPRVTPTDFAEARLLDEPVIVDQRLVGRVEVRHSLLSMNAKIGRQMKAGFAVFTLFVLIGSVVTGVLVYVADRTINRQYEELAEAQRRLSESDRLASIGAVASAVAHEINNPAGVLVARSDYLLSVLRDDAPPPSIQEDLETIRRQAQRIARTVRDLLHSAVRTRSAQDLVDLGRVATSAIGLVRPAIRRDGVTFEWQAAPGPVLVWGDRDRLEQVLVNLLSNAAQAIPDRGCVTVTASIRPGGAWADLVVRDTGSGIRPEDLARIFDPFFTTKEPGVGTGLGLSIVRRIVHDHGGHIQVDTAWGRGTEFRVALPAASIEPRGAAPRAGDRRGAGPASPPRGAAEDVLDG